MSSHLIEDLRQLTQAALSKAGESEVLSVSDLELFLMLSLLEEEP